MSFKTKCAFTLGSLFIIFGSSFALSVKAGGVPPSEVQMKASHDLKQFMYKFGISIAGIEILRVKEKKPDWKTIDLTLKEMNENLEGMQTADTSNTYKQYTDQLAAQLMELKMMSRRKDKNIYDGFDKLTNTCFQCHAVHRPSDFLKPKENRQISGEN